MREYVEQVVKVTLVTSSRWDPGGRLRHDIRDTIFSKLTTPDAMSGLTTRDSINSMVTSWLLGGIAVGSPGSHVEHSVGTPGQAGAGATVASPGIANQEIFYVNKVVSVEAAPRQRSSNHPTCYVFGVGQIDQLVLLEFGVRKNLHQS